MTAEASGSMTASAPDSPAKPQRGRRRQRRHGRGRALFLRLLTVVAPGLLSGALRLLSWTVRVRYVNADALFARWARGERVIVAFWHNRVLMMPLPYQGRGHKMCIMNSQSRDGEIATRALRRWGIRSVRGSATRGGAGGFLQLVRAYRDGYDLAVVPDGPRGPRYVAKPGVIHLARATGAPVVPVSYAANRKRQLRSWDRLIVPLPFARLVFVMGQPLQVPRHAGTEEVQALRLELENRLNQATAEAETQAARSTMPGDLRGSR